jgi:glycosyltransferase involved in cell wall biosynthesis
VDLSIIVPVYNEEESLPRLVDELHGALRPTGLEYELVFVDDGSRDRSCAELTRMAGTDQTIVVLVLRRNFGQTAAMQAGFDHARGATIVTLDADLQNDPADIPKLYAALDERDLDMIAGWRADRKDRFFDRRLPSMLANRLISWITGVKLHDYGCTLKAMRADVAKELRLYGEMHRFIPAIANWIGVRVGEMKVNHRARQFGVSKYGIGRTVRVFLDLVTVRFLQGYLQRPMQIFGLGGLASFALGFGISAYLTYEKFFHGEALAARPLLLLGVLLIVVGLQLMSLGLVADVLARTYYESQRKPPYYLRRVVRSEARERAAESTQRATPLSRSG